jgi:hypothetical protein
MDQTPIRMTYSVVCAKADHSKTTVATGLSLIFARALCHTLDLEYRERIEASGKHYSSWTADLHHCELETNNQQQKGKT